ncbi:MAG: heat-inducible transcriptional repressor HrcA [Clostridia bacterium]|nr:heat-inducible transcriptional repressor HrcA [Clostridia bacterium]
MALNERKIKILEAIITDYIATAEPVGSRTIAKKYDLGVSPATIRNEMSDLEEMGFIEQPHTSAGRIPSERGYRLYVDNMMRSRELTSDEVEFLKNAISLNVGRVEYLMQQTAKALAMLTNYTTVVTEPKSTKVKIKHIQLVPIDSNTVAAVVVTDSKAIKNHIIRTGSLPNGEELYKISYEITNIIKDCSLEDIDKEATSRLINKFDNYKELIAKVFKAIINTARQEEDVHLYTSGVRNLLGFPEFSDIEKARNIFRAFEEKDMLITLLGEGDDKAADKIQILIGGENNMEELKDCSIVKANYKFGVNSMGRIGVIGPTRMNYSQTVSVLDEIVKKLDTIIDSMLGNGEGGYDG